MLTLYIDLCLLKQYRVSMQDVRRRGNHPYRGLLTHDRLERLLRMQLLSL